MFLGGNMANLNLQLPDEIFSEITKIASQMKQSPEDLVQLALSFFLQTDAVENAMEGLTRKDDGESLVDFPQLKEELGLDIQFHPAAMEELDAIEEEDQIEILEEFINRISSSEEEENTIDLILQDDGEQQMVLSSFAFGDLIYQLGKKVVIYHLALNEDDEDEDDDMDIEEDDAQFIEALLEEEQDYKLAKSDN